MNARSGKNKSRAAALKHKLGTGAGKYKLRTGIYKLRARRGGLETQIPYLLSLNYITRLFN